MIYNVTKWCVCCHFRWASWRVCTAFMNLTSGPCVVMCTSAPSKWRWPTMPTPNTYRVRLTIYSLRWETYFNPGNILECSFKHYLLKSVLLAQAEKTKKPKGIPRCMWLVVHVCRLVLGNCMCRLTRHQCEKVGSQVSTFKMLHIRILEEGGYSSDARISCDKAPLYHCREWFSLKISSTADSITCASWPSWSSLVLCHYIILSVLDLWKCKVWEYAQRYLPSEKFHKS